ncbi:60S ribosomal protein L5-1 [Hibiscus syriacus]|uniref:60S ribosomal protein L5-1 n=1 Tax=Hibiscus syriacus TaxID=106335 RepID=A0A6A3BSB2_HIBSY|nr:60S ribosomal protein L5-1 [Hibiscus syriacus]
MQFFSFKPLVFNLKLIQGFVKAQKTKAYFKRFQVPFKRRREGKTDYRARIRLINQDKNKYNTPKATKMLLRILKAVFLSLYFYLKKSGNKDVTAQIVSANIAGDTVLASAYSHELPGYGLEVGLTNYAAAYCTGCFWGVASSDARMDENIRAMWRYIATGEDYSVDPTDTRRPFRALLDVGLIRTTTGNRVFGALKGALDAGLDIPHSDKRFAGFSKGNKQLDAEVHRNYIYGGHVAAYMRMSQRSISLTLASISRGESRQITLRPCTRKFMPLSDPTAKKSEKEPPKQHKRFNLKKLTYEERKAKLIERLKALNAAQPRVDFRGRIESGAA